MKRLAALLAASLLLAGCTAAGSGGMRASRPTAARKAAAVPVWPQTQNLFVGAGFIPPGEPCAAAGCGGMGASRPTDARWVAVVRFRGSFRKVCRGGIYCARRRVSEANRRTAAALRPEIPPGALRRRRVPGTMQASSPTGVCCNAGPQLPGWPRHFPRFRRAGVHARRTLVI